MTDVKYIGGNPVCDVTARGDIAVLQADTEYTQDIPLLWERGTIGTGSGSGTEVTNRIYAKNFIPVVEGLKLTFDESAKVGLRFYSDASVPSYIQAEKVWRTESPIDVYAVSLGYEGANYVRINCAYADDRDVSADEDMAALGRLVALDKTYHIKDLESRVTSAERSAPSAFDSMFTSDVGNCGILCAKEHHFVDGSAPTYEWYLLGDPATNAVYYSKDMTKKEYLFTFNDSLGRWSFGIDKDNNILCCKQSEYLSDSLEHDDSLRVNPIVYLFSERYSEAHEVDFGSSLKPCGWLSSVGFICLADGSCLIAEYTRPVVETASIWKISGDPSDASNWSIKQTFELSGSGTGFKHIHCVQQDFYTGVCYFSTGDDDTSSHWYYSTDNGSTWTLGKGNSEKYCRFLNLIFTPDYVYWATDSYKVGYHWIFRAGRDANGVVDFSNITDLHEIPLVSNLATYGCCYFPEYNALLLMERCDNATQLTMPVRLYDIETNTLHTVWTFTPATSHTEGGLLGFRTRFCTWYPKGLIRCAWHLKGSALGSRGVNENAMFGNVGSIYTQNNINNAEIRIYKDGSTYRMTLDTAYV